jgi:hypothetical protein
VEFLVERDAGLVRGLELDLVADGGGEDGAAEDRNQDGQEYERPSRAGYASSLFQGCLLGVYASRCGFDRRGPVAMDMDLVL